MTSATDKAMDALERHHRDIEKNTMAQMFDADPGRFDKFSLRLDDLLFDFSKNRVTSQTLDLLVDLATAAQVEARRDAMFAGEPVNQIEGRAALHTALRRPPASGPLVVGGEDITPEIFQTRRQMARFASDVRQGTAVGATGKAFTDVVNIGIGGSDLGPALAVAALGPYHDGPRVHFVANIDAAALSDVLKNLDPQTTLFLIASKTFTTQETMTNAASARVWLVGKLGDGAVAKHFGALSSAREKAVEFGIVPQQVFAFRDWVGGRYSVWSAIGLSVMLAVGPENFEGFLAGAFAADRHFKTAPLPKNIPVIMALLGIWYRDVWQFATQAIVPYEQRLALLPAYLQQLDMESNGKRVTQTGAPVARPTGPVVWGATGTPGQHAFFQLLHQGCDVVPCDFIVARTGHEQGAQWRGHRTQLVANCLGQAQALMAGRSAEQTHADLLVRGASAKEADRLAPHKTFPGNRPSNMFVHDRLTPFALGRLLALYEHKVFVCAMIWDINPFDQWGVELGKEICQGLVGALEGKSTPQTDASTVGLLKEFRSG
ncbi:MAG: glucose-6-phosphate isomerase [Alphaproteobacteria bacterium]